MKTKRPTIIEVAINGAQSRSDNPNVPITVNEIVESISACVDAGASVIHAHAGQPIVGAGGHHDSRVYADAFRRVRERYPNLMLYPTLPGGGCRTTMQERLSHITELVGMGLVEMIPVDPGSMNLGRVSRSGKAPSNPDVYRTTFGDVAWAFEYCRANNLICTLSVFEPGFVRLVQAHFRAGTLPLATIVKLEFGADHLLFGLPADRQGLECWLRLFDSDIIPWMVTFRGGDANETLADLAIARGGHVRVGIEDYGGHGTPRNEELVGVTVRIAERHGRRPAQPAEIRSLLARSARHTT